MVKRSLYLAILVALNGVFLAPAQATPLSTSEADSGQHVSVTADSLKLAMAALQSRIAALKQGGTGVGPFQKIFDEIGALANAGKMNEASQLMSDLSIKLSSQENLRDQAKRLGATRRAKVQQATVSPTAGTQPVWIPDNSGNDAARHKSLPDRINCLKSNLIQMQSLGMPVSDFFSRIAAVEKQASTSPKVVSSALDKIAEDMAKASIARNEALRR